MPPKLQIRSLAGDNALLPAEAILARPLIELEREQDDFGTNQQSVVSTLQLVSSTPCTVALEPPVPVVVSGTGSTLQIRQLWEGTVTEVRGEGFVATLNDRTKPCSPDEQAIFEFESFEVPTDDQPLVTPGSVFYWMMGTERTHSGQIRNVSSVEFRRLPFWTKRSLVNASERVAHLKEWFSSEK